jgi:sigma-B regulation protein RsbU (phosphoserine phosphatase)
MSEYQPVIEIVDDEPLNITLLEAILKKDGYSVLSAPDGQQAINIAKDKKPDLILLDIMMPGIDGFEVCRQLKDDAETADIPVVFISAMTDSTAKVQGLEIGAVDYITKPFDKSETLARVSIHVKKRISERDAINKNHTKLEGLHEAQQSILVSPSCIKGANFGVHYESLQEAGGDFYDVITIGEGLYGFFVADASGHNLKASFVTPALKALFGSNSNPMYTATETMTNINGALKRMLSDGSHVTACYAKLNRRENSLEVISAAHPPVIYMELNSPGQMLDDVDGDVLGAFDGVKFKPFNRSVKTGDRFFMYSDGLIELQGSSPTDRKEGIESLRQACFDRRDLPIQESVDAICEDILGGSGNDNDDIVLLGVQI